jgi:hypothetical protein
MNTQGTSDLGVSSQVWDRQTFGPAVVSKTLDYMNKNQHRNQTNNSYEFQKDVLMPVYTGKGTLMDDMA